VGPGSNKVAVTLNSADKAITIDIATQNLAVFGVATAGVVPGPQATDLAKFLRADGTWQDAGGTGGTGGGVAPDDAQNIIALSMFSI